MPTCRSCPAEVVFVRSATTGKNMILDAKPKKGIVIDPSGPDTPGFQVARVVDVYTDHHATCPRAADWRGAR